MNILIIGKGYVGNYIAKSSTEHTLTHIGKVDLDYANPSTLEFYIKNSNFD